MATIGEIRQKYPQYNDLDDQTLADSFHTKFYNDIPKDQFYQTLGIGEAQEAQEPQEQPQEESLLKKIGSFGIPKGGSGAIEKIGQFAQGIPTGLGNALVGGFQAATDLGEAGARKIEESIYGDTLNQETIGTRLSQGVEKRKEEQSQLPTAERAGIVTGEIAPYLTSGLGSGAKVAAKLGGKTLAKVAGAATAGAIGGGTATGLSQREEEGLGGRIEEAGTGAAVGAVAGGALYGAGKLIGQGAKQLMTPTKPEDILARRLPAGQTAELLEKLKTATPDSPVLLPDIAGDEMQGLTRAIGKLSGGKDIISDALNNRSQGAVTRVINQLSKDVSSVDNYFGNLDDLSKARSSIAAPLYKKAFEQNTILDKKKNKALFKKIAPDIRDARRKFRMGNAPTLIKKNTIDREELIQRASGSSGIRDEQALGEVADSYQKALAQFNQNKPKRLIQYIKEQGGISDFKGELKTLGITNKTLPAFLRKEGTSGTSIDDVGEKLQEAGLFQNRPTVNEVIDLIEQDIRGKEIFMPSGSQNLYDDASSYLEQFDRSGIDIEAINLLKKNKDQSLSKKSNAGKVADDSLVMLDSAKKILDDKIGVAIRGGENQQARVLTIIKKELVNKLDELNPDYKKARQVFSDFASIQNAQEQGLQFSKLRPEELRRYMSNLGVSEKEAFRIGVRENLQKTVTSTSEGADPAKRIFGNTFKRDQLKAIFPDQTKFKQFEKRMLEETQAAETKFKVLGGSRTDINIEGDKQFLRNAARLTTGVALNSPVTMVNAATSSIRNIFGGISEKNAKRLATILVNKKESIKLLEGMLKKEQAPVQKRLISDFIKSIRPELLITKGVQNNGD
jgi:hypothetical protein